MYPSPEFAPVTIQISLDKSRSFVGGVKLNLSNADCPKAFLPGEDNDTSNVDCHKYTN